MLFVCVTVLNRVFNLKRVVGSWGSYWFSKHLYKNNEGHWRIWHFFLKQLVEGRKNKTFSSRDFLIYFKGYVWLDKHLQRRNISQLGFFSSFSLVSTTKEMGGERRGKHRNYADATRLGPKCMPGEWGVNFSIRWNLQQKLHLYSMD